MYSTNSGCPAFFDNCGTIIQGETIIPVGNMIIGRHISTHNQAWGLMAGRDSDDGLAATAAGGQVIVCYSTR
jgi:hypothetical protein